MANLLKDYRTLVFDCDGVVLNSNQVKTKAFYQAAKHFGHDAAQALVDYHVANGGISRYLKFKHFLDDIIRVDEYDVVLQDLLKRFSSSVKHELMACEASPWLSELRDKTPNANWLIVSGGDQAELREIFEARGLFHLFDGGIFGSPDQKPQIIAREVMRKNIMGKALLLGDSRYDYESAMTGGLDFLFMSQWTELKEWQQFCHDFNIESVASIKDLL